MLLLFVSFLKCPLCLFIPVTTQLIQMFTDFSKLLVFSVGRPWSDNIDINPFLVHSCLLCMPVTPESLSCQHIIIIIIIIIKIMMIMIMTSMMIMVMIIKKIIIIIAHYVCLSRGNADLVSAAGPSS